MTLKEKAKELFIKFRILALDNTIEKRERTAKNCALIVVEELIKDYDQYSDLLSRLVPCGTEDIVSIIEKLEYLKRVKEEIERNEKT
jgi:hypothetical protein